MKFTGNRMLWTSLPLLLITFSLTACQITFFDEFDRKGDSVSVDGDPRSCTDVPRELHDRASSVDTNGNCVIVFENERCSGKSIRLEPDSPNQNRLDQLNFDDMIDSMQLCMPPGEQCSGFTLDVDTSQASDLQQFGEQVKTLLEEWYPKVCKLLLSPVYLELTHVTLKLYPFNGVANADWFNGIINGNSDYYRDHQDDLGSMIHEMAHMIQRYWTGCNGDGWLVEGIADWVRRIHYEPDKPGKPSEGDSYETNAVFFLNWMDGEYPDMIHTLNAECRAATYERGIFEKITGLTVDELWEKMMREA